MWRCIDTDVFWFSELSIALHLVSFFFCSAVTFLFPYTRCSRRKTAKKDKQGKRASQNERIQTTTWTRTKVNIRTPIYKFWALPLLFLERHPKSPPAHHKICSWFTEVHACHAINERTDDTQQDIQGCSHTSNNSVINKRKHAGTMNSAAAGLSFFGPLGTEPPHVYTRKPECPHRIYTHPATTMLSSNAKLTISTKNFKRRQLTWYGMSRYEAQDLKQLLMLAAWAGSRVQQESPAEHSKSKATIQKPIAHHEHSTFEFEMF